VLALPVISLSLRSLALQVVIMAAAIEVAWHETPAVPTPSDNDRWSRLPLQVSAVSFACYRTWGTHQACWCARAILSETAQYGRRWTDRQTLL